jgi:hypothetical protein
VYHSAANTIFIVVVCVLFYFIPSIIGWRKRNAGTIVAVNIFLGRTMIGYSRYIGRSVNPNQSRLWITSLCLRQRDCRAPYVAAIRDLDRSIARTAVRFSRRRSILSFSPADSFYRRRMIISTCDIPFVEWRDCATAQRDSRVPQKMAEESLF